MTPPCHIFQVKSGTQLGRGGSETRADRLLSIVLLLQAHRQLTSRELARRLEVAERTIHRDMEALSAAGIPVVAERGARGGWSYRTNLTGLNEAEVQSLFVIKPPRLLADLKLEKARIGSSRRLSLKRTFHATTRRCVPGHCSPTEFWRKICTHRRDGPTRQGRLGVSLTAI
jgi:biotin operon repressor